MKMKKQGVIIGMSLAAALSVTAVSANAADTLYGDANCDGIVSIADATAILQHLGNRDKYALSAQGEDNGDVNLRGNGITAADALAIQKLDAGLIKELPESWLNEDPDPVSTKTYIHLKGTEISIEGDYATAENGVVTITHSGEFYVDGTLDNGQIAVSIPDETVDAETVKIFLNGVNITGKSAPAIYIENAENTSINLVDGTENTLSDGDAAYTGDWAGAAVIEAKDDITIKGGDLGTGVLNITANTQDGFVCNNDIKFTGGTTNITTLNSADKTDAVKGKKSVTVKDSAVVNIEAEGDGLKSSKGDVSIKGGTISIKAGNDAIQAETTIDISNGTVVAGGDRGLTAGTGLNITGGTVVATATDYQVDTVLMGGTTQGTMILNCIANPAENDGCWKKANSIYVKSVNEKFTKKYAYVLISDASIKNGSSYELTNVSTGNAVQYSGGVQFNQTDVVTVYNEVNPAGVAAPGTTTPENPVDGEYTITLSSSGIQTNAPSGVASVNGAVLTINQPGLFAVSGEMSEGQIVVDVDKTAYPDGVVELDLMGVNLSNSSDSPIYVAAIGDEVQIVAKKGYDNTISDGTSYTNADGSAGAIYACDDIKFKGTGNLTVNGNCEDGIVCKNDIKIYNGNLTVNAADDGIRGKDSVKIGNDGEADYSTLNITVNTKGGDGIKSTETDPSTSNKSYGIVTINGGTVDINAYADGIQAEQNVVINGGDINIYTHEGSGFTGNASSGSTGGNTGWGGRPGFGMDEGNSNKTDISAKGIKAVGLYDEAGTTWQSEGNITVNGGNITVDSSDDSLHCGGSMFINGGSFLIATADDGFHSDHDLTLGNKGGSVEDFNISITKCYEGVEGQNIYQHSGTVIVKSDDDGYNAAGGSDGSGNTNNGGWNQGGFGSAGNNMLEITGGIAIVQSASGDHDAFDSNGNISISGGIIIANGQDPLDCDGTNSITGGTVVTASSQGNGSIAEGTQFTLADGSGNVIVSFKTVRALGSISFSNTAINGTTAYTGGTISGGTNIIKLDASQTIYASGTISGGTTVTAGSGSGGGNNNRPF